MPAKTIIYGAYGAGNLGDDAILLSAMAQHAGETIEVVSYGPPKIAFPPPYIEHFEFIKNPPAYIFAGDTLIFAGGGLFWAASHGDDMRNLAKYARSVGADVRIERLGAQGVHSNLEAATELMGLSSFISVRDENSVALLKRLGVSDRAVAEPDFVLELKNPKPPRDPNSPFRIGLSHSATPFYHDEAHRDKTLAIYKHIVDRHPLMEFVYLPHTRHFNVMAQNDIIVGEHFWKVTGGRVVNPNFPQTVEELLAIYATIDAAIGWRYHMLVMAKITGVPSAFLGQMGEHKYGAFARENNVPQIDFDKPVAEIVASATRFLAVVAAGTAT